MIIFPNGVFSFRVLPLERTFSNTRVIISKLGGVYEDIRKSPNMFARRLRIPAARGPLFEYLLMQRARVLKISTLKASEKEKLTKNISRVHFCVNVKRNRSRMKPRNPASKENRGLQLEEKLPSVSRNSALIQQCTDSTNYGRVLQVRSRGSAWTRPVRKGDRLLVLPFVSECW